jgi:hypothetical protein
MPDKSIITANALIIGSEMKWLEDILQARLDDTPLAFPGSNMPGINVQNTAYAELVKKYELSPAERLLLICSLIPHISPETFTEKLRDKKSTLKVSNAKLGGYFDHTFTSFVPTLQTVLYLLSGDDMSEMFYYQLFLKEGALMREQIITLRQVNSGSNDTNLRNQAITLSPEYIEYLISGKKPRPVFGRHFPATLITTALDWDQLIVPGSTKNELERIAKWSRNGRSMVSRANNKLNSSFSCLFYGPSGSGKTLAAQLLGKSIGVDVYKIDLSMIVSKYIGETEKNLSYLFDNARNKNWILFFDEADSLFGKRTEIHDSKDKWANLEMSYLLQRMEEHDGITILATNLKDNIDQAMSRRFQSVVYFSRPDKEHRVQLWKKLMPSPYSYHPGTDFDQLARYELTGGNIVNVIKAACLESESRKTIEIADLDITDAIKREYAKENRFT